MSEKYFKSEAAHPYHSRNDMVEWLKNLEERVTKLEAALAEFEALPKDSDKDNG